MTRIVLTEEQAQIWRTSREPVEMCDPSGTTLKILPPLCTDEELQKAKAIAAKHGRRYSGQQVRELLHLLEQTREREGPFGEQRLQELLQDWRQGARLREDDPPHYVAWARPVEREQR